MDNITHAFVGVALAECALPTSATRTTRRVFMVAAVAAANAPDIDLFYTWITEAPLGYLLHHRGHSHTWPGLVALSVSLTAALRLWPAGWSVVSAGRARFLALMLVALVSHLLLDAANVYGTHLLYPFTSRWYYGDAVFIFEPWVWLLLGVAVTQNALGPWSRRIAWGLTVVPTVALAALGLVAPGVLGLLAAAVAGLWLAFRRWPPRQRAAVALVGTILAFVAMFGVSRAARAATIEVLRTVSTDAIVDVVANPNPAAPWCWSVVSMQRTADEASLTVRRGTLSLWPGLRPADTCATHRLAAADPPLPPVGDAPVGRLIWNREWHVDLVPLRDRAATDCRVRAWLQFGRVPFVDDGHIVDLRFDNPLSANFSAMAIDDDRRVGCPSRLTNWAWPRSDVLVAD